MNCIHPSFNLLTTTIYICINSHISQKFLAISQFLVSTSSEFYSSYLLFCLLSWKLIVPTIQLSQLSLAAWRVYHHYCGG